MSDVITARDNGAFRVELCSAIGVGGLTPSAAMIAGAVRECGPMRVHVLIRPRGGDFVYTSRELAVMEADIVAARAAGAHGVVIGALTRDGAVDTVAMRRLLGRCGGMDVTFHRAFDEVDDPVRALSDIADLGVRRILTSGMEATAMEGAATIARLVKAAPRGFVIMPGSGVTPANIAELEAVTGAAEFHSTCTDKSAGYPCQSRLFSHADRPVSPEIVRTLVNQ